MWLGNFLDPALTIYDISGGVVAYMDERLPMDLARNLPALISTLCTPLNETAATGSR